MSDEQKPIVEFTASEDALVVSLARAINVAIGVWVDEHDPDDDDWEAGHIVAAGLTNCLVTCLSMADDQETRENAVGSSVDLILRATMVRRDKVDETLARLKAAQT